MDEIKAKQQVVEKIKEATKILVTVSDNPSVDALSAALALTMVLDKQEKYATAIFSGETPPAIAFLEPEKTFDDTTDSLRDFIIALNKEKADHLRYKVEGDAVKIFITPYKTTISEQDLEFSQGDYNVELVIALGVDNQDHLDGALENHGKILHDASIITMTAGDQTSNLGGTDWHDSNSSSLSEMVAGLAEALKDDKKKSLLDGTIATALLTGIVAETDRFSNEHTTSKALTVAASLMAAGADQQLVANELQAARTIEVKTPDDDSSSTDNSSDGDVEVDENSSDGSMTIKKDKESSDSLAISHDGETLADLDRRVLGEEKAKEKVAEEVEAVQEEAKAVEEQSSDEPVLGGTLNATAEQAAEDARREEENDQNKTILSHSYLGGSDPAAPGTNGVNETPITGENLHPVYALEESELEPSPEEPASSVAFGGEKVIQPLSEPQTTEPAPVEQPPVVPPADSAYAPAPEPAPNPTPADLGLPLPPPIPDFSQLGSLPPTPAPAIPLPPTEPPAILGDILAPEPTPTDTSNAVAAPDSAYAPEPPVEPPVPPVAPQEPQAPQAPASPSVPPVPPAPQNGPADPGQFQIPGQQ